MIPLTVWELSRIQDWYVRMSDADRADLLPEDGPLIAKIINMTGLQSRREEINRNRHPV